MTIAAIIIVNVLLDIAMLGGLAHMMSHQDETTRRESTPTALSDALPTQAP